MSKLKGGKNQDDQEKFASAIRKEFNKGEKSARDPINANLPLLALHKTTLYSKWLAQVCPKCDFLFREGDRVRICPKCQQVFHDDPDRKELSCWQNQFDGPGSVCECGQGFVWNGYLPDEQKTETNQRGNEFSAEIYQEILDGLSSEWVIPGKLKVLLAKEGDGAVGHICPFCAFKIRPGDRYVRCEDCKKAYFHNDIFRHLVCWNEWKSYKGRDYCPISNEKCNYNIE